MKIKVKIEEKLPKRLVSITAPFAGTFTIDGSDPIPYNATEEEICVILAKIGLKAEFVHDCIIVTNK